MTAFLQLRSANSGAPFVGTNQNDTVLWDATERAWYVGAGGGGGAVSSVFGRVGAVVAATGDYDGDQVDNVSTVPGASLSDALDYLLANAGAVASVFGRVGVVVAATGDYDSDQVDNVSGVSGSSVSDALDALDADIAALITGVSSVFGRVGAVAAATNDYTSTQVQNVSGVAGTGVTGALNTLASAISALVTGVSSFNSRTGAVAPATGDYSGAQITDTSNLPGTSVTDALNYLAQAAAAVAGGATPALPFATNRYQKLTLSANASPTMTVPPAGVEAFLEVIQPAAGGPFSITAWPAIVDWDVVSTGGGAPSIATAANAINLFRFISDGTRLRGAAHGEY